MKNIVKNIAEKTADIVHFGCVVKKCSTWERKA
jgi:hypothetical protein